MKGWLKISWHLGLGLEAMTETVEGLWWLPRFVCSSWREDEGTRTERLNALAPTPLPSLETKEETRANTAWTRTDHVTNFLFPSERIKISASFVVKRKQHRSFCVSADQQEEHGQLVWQHHQITQNFGCSSICILSWALSCRNPIFLTSLVLILFNKNPPVLQSSSSVTNLSCRKQTCWYLHTLVYQSWIYFPWYYWRSVKLNWAAGVSSLSIVLLFFWEPACVSL